MILIFNKLFSRRCAGSVQREAGAGRLRLDRLVREAAIMACCSALLRVCWADKAVGSVFRRRWRDGGSGGFAGDPASIPVARA